MQHLSGLMVARFILKKMKRLVSTTPVLHMPNWRLPFHIASDTFDIVVGVVLGQEEHKKPYTIYYANKNLSLAELNYMVTEKEFLVVIFAIKKFRRYITSYPTFVHTDHLTIRYLSNKPITSA